MSFLVVLDAKASAGVGSPALYCRCRNFEYRPAFALYLPSCVAVLIPADELQEGETVYLLTCEVLKVPGVCH